MEVWVRSQDKRSFMIIEHISAEEIIVPNSRKTRWCVTANFGCIGEYQTKERCLEIIDEIQSLFGYALLGSVSADGSVKNEYRQRDTAVYEMPKE